MQEWEAAQAMGARGDEHAALRRWLVEQVAGLLATPVELIRADLPLAEYGLDSVTATSLSADIEVQLGIDLGPAMLWDYPTIDDLVGVLAGAAGADAARRSA